MEIEKLEEKSPNPQIQLAEIFDLAKLKSEIHQIIEEYKDQHRNLEMTVLKQPVTLENETVTFQLNGEIQEGIFHKIKHEILHLLRGRLSNHSIHLDSVIMEEKNDGKRKLYTSTDKLNYLREKSPGLQELQRRFGLETDF